MGNLTHYFELLIEMQKEKIRKGIFKKNIIVPRKLFYWFIWDFIGSHFPENLFNKTFSYFFFIYPLTNLNDKCRTKKFYTRRNNNKVDSMDTGRIVIVHLFP